MSSLNLFPDMKPAASSPYVLLAMRYRKETMNEALNQQFTFNFRSITNYLQATEWQWLFASFRYESIGKVLIVNEL